MGSRGYSSPNFVYFHMFTVHINTVNKRRQQKFSYCGEASCLGSFLRAFINLLFNETLLSIVDL